MEVDPLTGVPPPSLLSSVAWGVVAGDVHRVVAGSGAGKDVLASITPERCRVRALACAHVCLSVRLSWGHGGVGVLPSFGSVCGHRRTRD